MADNKAIVASSQNGLQELMNRLNTVTKEYGVKINKENEGDLYMLKKQ